MSNTHPTQEQLEALNNLTVQKLIVTEYIHRAGEVSRINNIRRGVYKMINELDVIPMEELMNDRIPTAELERKYKVFHKKIDEFRSQHNVSYHRCKDLSVIPHEELHDTSISSNTLYKKYNVSYGVISRYRKKNGIVYLGKYNDLSIIPLEELNSPIIGIKELISKYNVDKNDLRRYRSDNKIRYINPNRVLVTTIPQHLLHDVNVSAYRLNLFYDVSVWDINEYRRKNGIK